MMQIWNNKLRESNIGCFVKGMIVAFAVCISFNMTTSNVLYVLIACLYGIICKQPLFLEQREKKVSIVLGVLFSLFTVMGNIENVLNVDFWLWPLTWAACFGGFYFCFFIIIAYLLVFIRNISLCEEKTERSGKQVLYSFLLSFVGLIVIWGIGLWISYPGNTTADSNGIINTALGNMDMNAAVPVVYVLVIRFLWNLGLLWFGTANASMALCSASQIVLLSLIVSYAISRLYSHKVKRWACVCAWLFYALVPYNVQLSHTLWKDIPFSAFVFLFMILIWELCYEGKSNSRWKEYSRIVLVIIAGAGMCLMRNNGLFAFIFFLPFGIAFFFKKNKRVMVSLIFTFVLVRIIQGPVYDRVMTDNAAWMNELKIQREADDMAHDLEVVAETEQIQVPEKNREQEVTVKFVQGEETIEVVEQVPESKTEQEQVPSTEMVSEQPQAVVVKNATDSYNASGIYIITVQQLARVAVDRRDLSEEDYRRLDKVIEVEEMRQEYDPHCRDSAGWLLRHGVSTSEYLKEWLYFGFKYPIQYILAYKDQTYGYWYPDVQYWVYSDHIRENDIGLYRENVLSEEAKYQQMLTEAMYQEIPIYGMVWSIGFIVWVTLFFVGVTFVKKGMKAVLPYIPVIGVWGTLLVATPVYAEFRYIYSMFLCIPLTALIPFIHLDNTQEKTCDER